MARNDDAERGKRGPLDSVAASLIDWVLALPALGYVALFLWLAARRMTHPYQLEWCEGAVLAQVQRVMAGEAIYVVPSFDYTAALYTPLYFYLSALSCALFGVSLGSLRLVSFLAAVGCLATIAALVRRETRSWACAAAAAGLYAASYGYTGSWFDLARVDSLFLFFCLASALRLRHRRPGSISSLVVAALLAALAFATKQLGLVVVGALSLYALVCVERGRRLVFPVVAGLCIGVGVWIGAVLSGGWSNFYIFTLPASHTMLLGLSAVFWGPLGAPFLVLALVAWLAVLAAKWRRGESEGLLFHLLFPGCLLAVSASSVVKLGSSFNALMPAFAAMGIVLGLVLYEAGRWLGEGERRGLALRGLVVVVGLHQLVQLHYEPSAQLPHPGDRAAGDRVLELVRGFEGDVYLPNHGYFAILAGKRAFSHSMALSDVLRSDLDSELKREIRRQTIAAVEEGRFSAIVLDARRWDFGFKHIREHYVPERVLFDAESPALLPITGPERRPSFVYVRRGSASSSLAPTRAPGGG